MDWSTGEAELSATARRSHLADLSIVDACVFHEWSSVQELALYFGEGWNDLILRPGDPMGPIEVNAPWIHAPNPFGAKAKRAFPDQGIPGSDYALLVNQLFSEGGRERVVLGYDEGIQSTVFSNYYAARAMARAANDWTLAEWLERNERLFGMVLISSALPEDAAAEIRRAGSNDRMVAVALGGNALGRSFGHPVYHPIFEAALEMELPLVLQVGSDALAGQITPPVAGGVPATYAEYRAMGMHSHMSHVASLIMAGVFERFPTLKLLLVGGGAAWIPGWLWRLDYWYKLSHKETPWLRQLPSEYFLQSVRVATYQLESPSPPDKLARALEAVPGFEQLLLYASCYPNTDAEEPATIAARLPEEWRSAAFTDNALAFFRWPGNGSRRTQDRSGDVSAAALSPGELEAGNSL